MPFGWVCFSNEHIYARDGQDVYRLNCLSAGSVSLTPSTRRQRHSVLLPSQLPFGWVCFSNEEMRRETIPAVSPSQLPFGWVCFSNCCARGGGGSYSESQLPFGWVCFSNVYEIEIPGRACLRLNCLSAGSVSLTCLGSVGNRLRSRRSQLPFGWVCFSNKIEQACEYTTG